MAINYTRDNLIDELSAKTGAMPQSVDNVLAELAVIANREAQKKEGFSILEICGKTAKGSCDETSGSKADVALPPSVAVPQSGQKVSDAAQLETVTPLMSDDEHFISFLCKVCGQEIEAPFDMAGSQDECPTCGATIDIPYLSEPGTSQTLKEEESVATDVVASKSRTLRIELPDDFL